MLPPIMFQGSPSPKVRPHGKGVEAPGSNEGSAVERVVNSDKAVVRDARDTIDTVVQGSEENHYRSSSVIRYVSSAASSSSSVENARSQSTSSNGTITQGGRAASPRVNENEMILSLRPRKHSPVSPGRKRVDGNRGRQGADTSLSVMQAEQAGIAMPTRKKTHKEIIEERQTQVSLRLSDYERRQAAYLKDAQRYHSDPKKYANELEQITTQMIQLHMYKAFIQEKGQSVTEPKWSLPKTEELSLLCVESPPEAVVEKIRKQVLGLPVSPEVLLPLKIDSAGGKSAQSPNFPAKGSSRTVTFKTGVPEIPEVIPPFSLTADIGTLAVTAQTTPLPALKSSRTRRKDWPVRTSRPLALNADNLALMGKPTSQGNDHIVGSIESKKSSSRYRLPPQIHDQRKAQTSTSSSTPSVTALYAIPTFNPERYRQKLMDDATQRYANDRNDPKLREISRQLASHDAKYSLNPSQLSKSEDEIYESFLELLQNKAPVEARPSSPFKPALEPQMKPSEDEAFSQKLHKTLSLFSRLELTDFNMRYQTVLPHVIQLYKESHNVSSVSAEAFAGIEKEIEAYLALKNKKF